MLLTNCHAVIDNITLQERWHVRDIKGYHTNGTNVQEVMAGTTQILCQGIGVGAYFINGAQTSV